jgi:hypothetical protein
VKRIAIFGATSGIAEAVARLWAAQGHALAICGRSAESLALLGADLRVRGATVHEIAGAVRGADAVRRIFEAARAALGDIDVVFIAFGALPDQERCETDADALEDALLVNGVDAVLLSMCAAAHLAPRGGTLAVLTSVAGDRGRPSNFAYGAAKSMVSTFLEGLRARKWRQGLGVVDIRPGFIRTRMTRHLDRRGLLWRNPAGIAPAIVAAIAARRPVVYVPAFWALIMAVIRTIPDAVFRRMKL